MRSNIDNYSMKKNEFLFGNSFFLSIFEQPNYVAYVFT